MMVKAGQDQFSTVTINFVEIYDCLLLLYFHALLKGTVHCLRSYLSIAIKQDFLDTKITRIEQNYMKV